MTALGLFSFRSLDLQERQGQGEGEGERLKAGKA